MTDASVKVEGDDFNGRTGADGEVTFRAPDVDSTSRFDVIAEKNGEQASDTITVESVGRFAAQSERSGQQQTPTDTPSEETEDDTPSEETEEDEDDFIGGAPIGNSIAVVGIGMVGMLTVYRRKR